MSISLRFNKILNIKQAY